MYNIIIMIGKYLRSIFFVLLILLFPDAKAIHELPLEIDTPLKASVLYFPTPATMRCLNHSNIPKTFRKAVVQRQVKFPNEEILNQTITIGTNGKKFIFNGNISRKDGLISQKIKGGPFFNINKGGEVKPFLFGLEDLIGLQRKVHVTDIFGSESLNYETFLRITKGKIGDLKYYLDLFGTDKNLNGQIKYILSGTGSLGDYKISIKGIETGKDTYELLEKYGPVEMYSKVTVYD